jgi:hypothetical protein
MHPGPTDRTIPSQPGFLNRARGAGGAGAEPTAATALPLHNLSRQLHPTSQALTTHPGPAYYKLLPVTLSFNSPTRYHSLHFLAFSASALDDEEKRSARLREAERSSGFRVANHPRSRRPASSPLSPPASASSPSLHCAAFPSSSSFSPAGRTRDDCGEVGGGGRREGGETPAVILHRVHEHILVAFACRYAVRPIAAFPRAHGIFSARVICPCVIIHVFDGFFLRQPPGE